MKFNRFIERMGEPVRSKLKAEGRIHQPNKDRTTTPPKGRYVLHDGNLKIELLIDFLFHLNDKKLINNHDFDYEKEAKKYIKQKQ